jgi:hypothetical protein
MAKSAVPAGPLDEYDLLEEIHLRERRQAHDAEAHDIFWPPRKRTLDDLRDYRLRCSRNEFLEDPALSVPNPAPPSPQLPEYCI